MTSNIKRFGIVKVVASCCSQHFQSGAGCCTETSMQGVHKTSRRLHLGLQSVTHV